MNFDDIKSNLLEMQKSMAEAHDKLENTIITGSCNTVGTEDKLPLVQISMTLTNKLDDVVVSPEAIEEGPRKARQHIREALIDLFAKFRDATQSKTMELLENMDFPEELQNLSFDDDDSDDADSSGTPAIESSRPAANAPATANKWARKAIVDKTQTEK